MSSNKVVLRSARPRLGADGGQMSKGLVHLLNERARKRPCFSGCWTSPCPPSRSVELERYEVIGSKVSIISVDDGARHLYHVTPWEYLLPASWISLLGTVIEKVSLCPPEDIGAQYTDLRGHVTRTAARLLRAVATADQVDLGRDIGEREDNISRLSEAVSRYTVGLGVFEVLLSDDRIEDVFVDAPSWENPVHVTVNGVSGFNTVCRCGTNITASGEEVERMASRFKQYSGRPFSEAFPVMETDVHGYDTRATVIGPPLSPSGTAVALRRHSRTPWTLLKLAYSGAIDTYTAALLSFLIDGKSTMLISGARGAGKSSLLSAVMFEFPVSQRILTIEDTLELPVKQMQQLGYKVQSLFVERRMEQNAEESTDGALRVSLRLGESAIVLGEVRGKEAQTLYQSMRAGKAGSSVLGTIHGDSARSVYERVVHDMGIAKEAFMATDVVVTMGLSRPGGSSRQVRRLIELAEVSRERGPGEFNQLVRLDPASGGFAIDPEVRSETIERIAGSWNMSYDEALLNIEARSAMRDILLAAASRGGREYLEPAWVCRCNEHFWHWMDEGDGDYDGLVNDFRRLVERRCGHELD